MGFKDNPIVYLSRKTWEYSVGNRPKVVLYLILFLFANITTFFEPLVIGKVLNIIQEQGVTNASLPSVIFYIALIGILYLVFWAFHGPARVLERANSFLVRANYKKFLLDGTMDLSAQWHTDHHSGETIDKIDKGTRALYRYSQNTYEVVETLLRFGGSFLALAYFNLHSIYIVTFMVIVTISVIIKFDNVLIKQYKELNKSENVISAKIFDTISNITTVIILRIEKLLSKAIWKKIMFPFTLHVRNSKINETKWFLVSACSSVMIFLVLASFIYFNFKAGNEILVGTVYILYGYVNRISSLFFRFAYRYGEMIMQKTRVENAEEVSNAFRKKKKFKQIDLNKKWNELKIRGLKFSYHTEAGQDLHLDNISMNIKRGQRIALIGESGSGKTTIMKIIRELYEPKKVKLYLDDKELKNNFSTISESITLIPQDPEIFATTIKENITLGIGYKMAHIKKYTDMARFTETAMRLPKKFNSSVVEKGVNLSGGEKQRLALARGLIAAEDKPILLLDEPTSSVDFTNEILIYHNIFKEFRNKTVISSIHRLHLLFLFDKIYYFRNGKIIASGTFEELKKTSNEFKELWKKSRKEKEVTLK